MKNAEDQITGLYQQYTLVIQENESLKSINKQLLDALEESSKWMDTLINQTPSSDLRNRMTDSNIKIKSAIAKAKL